jgi:hypothetical protein
MNYYIFAAKDARLPGFSATRHSTWMLASFATFFHCGISRFS